MSPFDGQRYSSPAPSGDAAPPVPDEDALAREFWDRIRLFAARRLDDVAAAEDVAQETLRRVVEALRAGRIENQLALPAFVYQTARHICLQRYRSSGREMRALGRLHGARPAAEPFDALTALITEERRAAVRAAVARLDERDRELLRLVFVEAMDTGELARRMALTPGALRVRKHRALGRLARLLGTIDPDDEEGEAKRLGISGNTTA